MSFASPKMFVWLIAIPAVIYWYVATQRRRAARAEALAGQGLVVTSTGSRRRRPPGRPLPLVFFVLHLTVLGGALAPPSATLSTPRRPGPVIVAFSDGENTNGVDPISVGQVASAAGVRVHAIGVGTEAGTTFQYGGFTIATALDSDELKQLASLTDGTYHTAGDSSGLGAIS